MPVNPSLLLHQHALMNNDNMYHISTNFKQINQYKTDIQAFFVKKLKIGMTDKLITSLTSLHIRQLPNKQNQKKSS